LRADPFDWGRSFEGGRRSAVLLPIDALMVIGPAVAKTKRARPRAAQPYSVISRTRDGRTRREDYRDAATFKARLLASAAEDEVVSFDDIVDLLETP
jgi:hypothetical protein